MNAFGYSRARTAEDAVAMHGTGTGLEYLAGGTTLIDLARLGVMRPTRMIDVNRLDLAKISWSADGSVHVGAMVRNSDLAHDSRIRERFPVLAEALLSGASAQLRNMATTGGNLLQRTRCPYFRDNISACNKRAPGSGCAARDGFNRSHAILGTSDACIATHPSDMCVALAALDAEIVVLGEKGERRIRFEDFHLLPGETPEKEFSLRSEELITGVIISPLPESSRSWYVKLRDRESFEFALASAAVVLAHDGSKIQHARVALGGVATKPWRARETEKSLLGAPPTLATFQNAAELALSGAKPHQHNAFKIELAERAIVRALLMSSRGQPPVRAT